MSPQRIKCELPTRELTVDGKEPPVKASYVGCCNGDAPEHYELFLDAMDRMGIADCMHIHAKPTTSQVWALALPLLLPQCSIHRPWAV